MLWIHETNHIAHQPGSASSVRARDFTDELGWFRNSDTSSPGSSQATTCSPTNSRPDNAYPTRQEAPLSGDLHPSSLLHPPRTRFP